MDFYNAVFQETTEAIEVYFPDIENAITFAATWDDAYKMAVDVLAAILADCDKRPPSTSINELSGKHQGKIMPVPVDEKIIQEYETTKRVNVSFPKSTLATIDEYRGKWGLKRSELLATAAIEYIKLHSTNELTH